MFSRKSLSPVLLAASLLASCAMQPVVVNAPMQPAIVAGIESSSPLAGAVLVSKCNTICEVLPADPQTGQLLPGYTPIDAGKYYATGLSPDGKTLAFVRYPQNEYAKGGKLFLLDLANWKATETAVEVNEFVYSMTFSPNGRQIAMVTSVFNKDEWPMALIDVAKQVVTAQIELDTAFHKIQYTADSAQIMAYGNYTPDAGTPEAVVALYDSGDLKQVWHKTLPEVIDGYFPETDEQGNSFYTGYTPGVVFEPTGTKLYIVHADSDRLTTVDFAAQSVTSVEIHPPQSWLDRLMSLTLSGTAQAKAMQGTYKQAVLSADGKWLYVDGSDMVQLKDAKGYVTGYSSVPLNLTVIEVASGLELKQLETPASSLTLSHDGSQLYVTGWDNTGDSDGMTWTRVLDANTLAEVTLLTDTYLMPSQQLDGQPILLESHSLPDGSEHMSVLELDTFEVKSVFSTEDRVSWLVLP